MSKEPKNNSMLGSIVGTNRRRTISFVDYCREYFILDNGQRYDPTARACMADVVEDYHSHPHIVIEKGAQTGFSTLAIAHTMYMVDVLEKNIIYYLPTDIMARRFGPTRFDPYINRSTYLQERLQGTDQAGLKQIGTHFLYVLGLMSKTGAISIPADEIVFDEVALIDPENMELAQDRISAPGSLGWQKYFSVALFPEDGTDELFQQSDMRKWLIKCSGCNYQAPVEDDWPENVDAREAGNVRLCCPKCGKHLNVNNGEWVAEHPDRKSRRGYRVPQIIIPGANMNLIWDRYDKAKDKPSKLATFRRSALAIPDSGNLQPVGPDVLRRIEDISDFYFTDYSHEMTAVGIDMGDKAHVAVVAPYRDEGIRLLNFWEIDVEDLLELVLHIERHFNIGALVIDAMPYKTKSKEVVRSLTKCLGYIQYFKGTEIKEGTEGEGEREVNVVTVDRDESLDETTDLFASNPPLALLPKPRDEKEEQIIKQVKTHLLKLTKEETEVNGEKRIGYKKKVPNHFGMAINSARIALRLATGKSVYLDPDNVHVGGRSKIRRILEGYG
ncbi:phage terminase large subunit family protein [Paenibacillus tyrfis]|uniref:phage terminase large subunit family protein n=1 Tax=Paenibacillus tyrfis TaxID=1501230 RepID=UPI00068A941D|nr:phage terminase large subunit family protein [Paenibacillus tyrfis]